MNEVTLKIKTVLDSKGLQQAVKEIDGVKSATQQAGAVAQKSNGLFSNFYGSLLRIAKLRLLRGIIRALTQAFKEGTENIYQYSVALGSADASHFATTMNELASSFLYLKNSIGSVVAPILSALLPALQTIVSWVALALDYLAQFFAVINGQSTYTVAKKQATVWKDVGASASGAAAAAKEYKNTIMSFDEIHALNDTPSSGGGGGGGASGPGYTDMFEEKALPNNIFTSLASAIKNSTALQAIKKHVSDSLDLAIRGIGPALSWLWGTLTGDIEMTEQAWNELYQLITENDTLQRAMRLYMEYESWVKTAIQNIKLWFLNAFEDIVEVARPLLEVMGVDVDRLTKRIEYQKDAIEDQKREIQNGKIWWNLWISGVDEATAKAAVDLADLAFQAAESTSDVIKGMTDSANSVDDTRKSINNTKDAWGYYTDAVFDANKAQYDGSGVYKGLYDTAWIADIATTTLKNLKDALDKLRNASQTGIDIAINVLDKNGAFTGGGGGRIFANGGIIPRYDYGGINSAQLFLANENGNAELIGNIGNRTAVANQGQMVEAMAQGVYQAMSDVMSQGGSNNIEVVFNVDSETLSRIVDKGNRSLNRRYNIGLA